MTMRSGVTSHAKTLLLRSRFYSGFRRVLPSHQIAILRYHAVCEPTADYAAPGICVSPAAFERHVAYLASNYRVLPLPDAVDVLTRGKTLPPNAAAITFDDGYADNLGAARTLARYGLSGTFYITAGCLADGAPFWPSELRALVRAMATPAIELRLNGAITTLPLATPQQRTSAISALSKMFKAHPIPVREHLRDQLRRLAGRPAVPSPMLTWEDLVTMRDIGMVIGSHTVSHPNLPNAGLDAARHEIVESKAMLEQRLGIPVTMFSYPNGGAERYMTPAIARLVRDAGFEAATTSRNAFAGPASDPFALERVQVRESLEDLVFALEIERFAFKPTPRPGEVE